MKGFVRLNKSVVSNDNITFPANKITDAHGDPIVQKIYAELPIDKKACIKVKKDDLMDFIFFGKENIIFNISSSQVTEMLNNELYE
jgi:hypothetical protein